MSNPSGSLTDYLVAAVIDYTNQMGRTPSKLERATAAIDLLDYSLIGFTVEKVGETLKTLLPSEAAKIQAQLKANIDRLASLKTVFQHVYDFSRYTVLPGLMEEHELTGFKVPGVGAVSLTADLRASIVAGKKKEAFEYLDDHGHGDLITQSVNAGTLKTLAKACIKKAVETKDIEEELPAEYFKIDPFTRAQIKRSK